MPPSSSGSATAHCVSMYMCCWLGREYLWMHFNIFESAAGGGVHGGPNFEGQIRMRTAEDGDAHSF